MDHTGGDTAIFSVIVAAIAVIVGGVMQFLTLKYARKNTISSLQVQMAETSISRLSEVLSEYVPLTYSADANFQSYILLRDRLYELKKTSDTNEEIEQLQQRVNFLSKEVDRLGLEEAKLRVTFELCLPASTVTAKILLEAMMSLRDHKFGSGETWLQKREKVVQLARELIQEERQRALDKPTEYLAFRSRSEDA